MERILTVAQVVVPIFAAILLGMAARRGSWLTREEIGGFQQFVMKIGLPSVVFCSCLTADIGAESLSSMAMVLPAMIFSTLLAFRLRKKRLPYHNLPMLFCAQETGMLGIPLFIILFGADQAYRMGVLDLTQAITAYPVIAILSADAGENPSVADISKKVVTSPLMILSVLGLVLNISGIGAWLDSLGLRVILTETATFLSQPVSALMIFSVGYNFSLAKGSRAAILKVSGLHFGLFAIFGILMQLGLCLLPNVDAMTRWALLLYCVLPASYLAPGLGRSEEDFTMASGVCSVMTIVSLLIFCGMAAVTA